MQVKTVTRYERGDKVLDLVEYTNPHNEKMWDIDIYSFDEKYNYSIERSIMFISPYLLNKFLEVNNWKEQVL